MACGGGSLRTPQAAVQPTLPEPQASATGFPIPLAPSPSVSPERQTDPTWRLGAPMLSSRSEMPAVVLGGRVYVPGGFGGVSRLEVYDPALDAWERFADLPRGRHHLMAAAYEGDLYIFGGSPPLSFGATKTVWRYSPSGDTWVQLPDMPEQVTAGAAVALGGRIYIVGGSGSGRGDEMLVFTPEDGSWATLPGPASPREHLAAVAFDNRLWVLGGRWRGIGEQAGIEIFDPSTGSWSQGPPLQVARAGFAAAVVGDAIVVAGGEIIFTGDDTLASVEILELDEDAWVFVPDLLFPVHGLSGVSFNGLFYLPGGSDRAGAIDNHGRLQILEP